MCGKFTMVFFPVVSTKGSEVKVLLLLYRRSW